MGDRAGEGITYGNLGCAYQSLGDCAKAIEYQMHRLAIAKEVGDRAGEGQAYANLGCAYQSQRDFIKAIKYQAQDLAIAKEVLSLHASGAAASSQWLKEGDVIRMIDGEDPFALPHRNGALDVLRLRDALKGGDRAGEGRAYGNLGNAFQSQGDYAKAIEHHAHRLAITMEVGDRAGEGGAYGNLGCAYQSLGDWAKSIEYQTHRLAIAKEVGDRAGEGQAYANLSTCHMHLNEFVKAVAYFDAQHALAISLKLAHEQSDAALSMGVALTLHVRASPCYWR